ncbi:glycosyltransferase family 2 protein [bacterium]|nr:glycosyltransferase family 2 protein [bacterium]MCI0603019.1 glycosyltransferase family 2 protein [bacterium]
MRVIALLATYNEERFIRDCLQNLIRQGAEIYLIDNSSEDQTVEIANQFLNRGLIGIEDLPRNGVFDLKPILKRKERLAQMLKADWFLHVDADEILLPPKKFRTLSDAFHEVERAGYNAVNFQEFTFIPTRESPEHDHPEFQTTMRWYYPFLPRFPHRVNAWKSQEARVNLAQSAGHKVRFPGLRLYPESFLMRHYLFLSIGHVLRKYGLRKYAETALRKGWHRSRVDWGHLTSVNIRLPSQTELRAYFSDDQLDPSNPWTRHFLSF